MDENLIKKLKKSIFISGMHRSGTSWAAEIGAGGKYLIKDEVSPEFVNKFHQFLIIGMIKKAGLNNIRIKFIIDI